MGHNSESYQRFLKVQEGSRRFKKGQFIFKAHSGHIQITFGSQSRNLKKVPEGSRRFKNSQEGSRRFKKVHEGSRRFKKVQEGSRFKKVQEESSYIQGTFRTHSNHIWVTSIVLKKVQEGSRRFKEVQNGSEGFKKVQECFMLSWSVFDKTFSHTNLKRIGGFINNKI